MKGKVIYEVGMYFLEFKMLEDISEVDFFLKVCEFNEDFVVYGILVQFFVFDQIEQ